jgi:hypothetical protein
MKTPHVTWLHAAWGKPLKDQTEFSVGTTTSGRTLTFGALSGSDLIVFRAAVENSDCATDLVQSRLTGLQLRLVPLQKSLVFKRKRPE